MGKKVLVVGGGGREHALVWKIIQSPLVNKVYCAPGNAGIQTLAECVDIGAEEVDELLAFAQEKKIDLTVVGPEGPLVAGIVDRFNEAGLTVFGPSKAAAEVEGSKQYMKKIMAKYNIPTSAYESFTDVEAAKAYVREQGAPIVVKTSGLAAGKGAIICQTVADAEATLDQVMVEKVFGSAGDTVVVEGFLRGEEASFLALVDGENVLPLAGSQDHKAVGEGDTGLNTGGMGAYSPAPVLTPKLYDKVMDQVMKPMVAALAKEGRPYRGVLYGGLMIEGEEIRVVEFNARFGDPETQPVLMRLRSDLVPLLEASAKGSLAGMKTEWEERAALCVVMAAGGYPGSYAKGEPMSGLDEAAMVPNVEVFHAGTAFSDAGEVVTSGGRVLGVTGLGESVSEAKESVYQAVDKINWNKAYYRGDIGYRAVAREKGE